MTPKNTPSGSDLEAVDKLLAFYKDKPDDHVIDTYAPGMTVGHLKTIRTALLRSRAIDEGFDAHEFAGRVAEPDDYMRGDVGKWRAEITVNWKKQSLGFHSNEDDAARAYNRAAKEHFGEHACLNIIKRKTK